MGVFSVLLGLVRALLLPRDALVAENLALRQQLAVLQRTVKRPRLRQRDRIFGKDSGRRTRTCLMS